MPTLPLFTPTPVANAWHSVTAPGGYEWWYFDAEDTANDRQIVAIFLDGFVFHPKYLRQYAWYRRFPTRIAPPLPRWFRCAYFVVYEHGKILSQFMRQYPAADFAASADRPDVQIGPNRFQRADDGALNLSLLGQPWDLTWRGPIHRAGQTLAGEFGFEPMFAHTPMQRRFLSREMTGADHHWVIANPLCQVKGEIQISDAQGDGVHAGAPRTIAFNGRGYHDHNFGTGPLGPGLKRWIWGRVLLDDSVHTFHFAKPADRNLPDEVHLIQADSAGVREIEVQRPDADWSSRTRWGLAYPNHLKLAEALELQNPRLIDSTPFYLRLMYDAVCAGKQGTALCEVAYPERLRLPVLGRMIEASIGKD